MSHRKTIITRPTAGSGVGSNIGSLVGALHLARRIGAGVRIDWTNLDELNDKSINAFSRFFDTPDTIAGVPVEYAKAGEENSATVDVPVTPDSLARLAAGDCANTVRLSPYHGIDRIRLMVPQACDTTEEEALFVRRAYLAIRPNDSIRARIDAWKAEKFAERFVVGINVRMGNGLFDPRSQYRMRVNMHIMRSRDVFVAGLGRAIAARLQPLPEEVRLGARVFFAADTKTMRDWLAPLPGFITRRTEFPPAGVGHAYSAYDRAGYSDVDAFEDILIDMYLLAECNALVYNYTSFNRVARISSNYFNGNLSNIEMYFPMERAIHRIQTGLIALRNRLF